MAIDWTPLITAVCDYLAVLHRLSIDQRASPPLSNRRAL